MKYPVVIKRNRPSGFALVVTLSLMILLATIALGFLSLASISLRSSTQGEDMATAQANARMSLMLAIGELQRTAGPDTRVTARADILDEANPPVLGVWRSWEGTNHETSGQFVGRPFAPGSDYPSVKETHFLGWLTSADAQDSLAAHVADSTKITLLGPGSVGSGIDPATGVDRDRLQIHLPPTLVSTDNRPGAMAWWIGGENQKAYIPKPEAAVRRGAAERKQALLLSKSHSVVDPKPYDLESVFNDPNKGKDEAVVNKAISLNQADFIPPISATRDDRRSLKHFHDLSTSAIGLLTNTATGGWRKDMSLLSERWNNSTFPEEGLPLFRLTPDPVLDTEQTRATPNQWNRAGSFFYPWASHGGTGVPKILQQAVASWSNLIDFTRFYKRQDVTSASNGTRRVTITDGLPTPDTTTVVSLNGGNITNEQYNNHLHKVRIFPVLARAQVVLSHYSESVLVEEERKYTPKLVMTPVFTLWNPYDVELTVGTPYYLDLKILPITLSYQIGSEPENTRHNCILYVDGFTAPMSGDGRSALQYALEARPSDQGTFRSHYHIPAGLNLKPGETKVYSVDPTVRRGASLNYESPIELEHGYKGAGGGHIFPVKVTTPEGNTKVIQNVNNTNISARLRFDAMYGGSSATTWNVRKAGVGTYLQTSLRPDSSQYPVQRLTTTYSRNIAALLHPEITDVPQTSLEQIDISTNQAPMPFASVSFGPRVATKFQDSTNKQHFTKGFVQSSPFMIFDSFFGADYKGMRHPLNMGYEFTYNDYKQGGIDSDLPNSSPTGGGYIITGDNSGNGVPRAVVAELPSRPLASLGELVNWDLRLDNPLPPFAFNLVGNSDASPLLPRDAVIDDTEPSVSSTDHLRHDDSYCANHLLFDDWFFSTITEDPATFAPPGRDQIRVYGDFVTGETPLTNRAYKPIFEDRAYVAAGNPAAELYNEHVNTDEAWKTIASRLEVEGMFNVNSTSVKAWRALLGHARDHGVLYYNSSRNITLSPKVDHPVTRFSIAGDVKAGEAVPGAFPEASQVIGYRTLDSDFLDALAEEVVKEIRLRGPFLSLAEFINRQLSADENLALAGALQSALNELTKNGAADNPLADLQGISGLVEEAPEGDNAEDKTGYVFKEAAQGYSTYGVPGWTRQADILRPIAPILSARDDTFTIRGYGDARDASGTVTASAVCEAVVRRTREFVDPIDEADTTYTLTSQANKDFGRRFEIISFRWLTPDEV